MFKYAITFPQLINQAVQLRLGDAELTRLRIGYDLAERIADGLYRSQGAAFINHLIRTSSIVMAHGGNINIILAAMHHSDYMLDAFQRSRRRRTEPGRREFLAQVLGAEVEEIVWEYSQHTWGMPQYISEYHEQLSSYGPVMKAVLFIRLANELEDHLDLAVLYRPNYSYRKKIESYGHTCIALASGLGLQALGDEIKQAYTLTVSSRISPSLVRSNINAYEMPRKHFGEKNAIEYLLSRVWGRFSRMIQRRM